MSHTLDSLPNPLVMDALLLPLALGSLYLQNQTSFLAKVVETTTTDSVEEADAVFLRTSYFTSIGKDSFTEKYYD